MGHPNCFSYDVERITLELFQNSISLNYEPDKGVQSEQRQNMLRGLGGGEGKLRNAALSLVPLQAIVLTYWFKLCRYSKE